MSKLEKAGEIGNSHASPWTAAHAAPATALARASHFSCVSAAILICGLTAAAAETSPSVRHPDGFWKCRPAGTIRGAFDNEDPVGLAAHAHIATDCALHWSDGHGAIYCFATPPSFLEFESNPDVLTKAKAFWRLEHPQN